MNELDLIRSFRADVPGPSAAATARAERAWRPAPRRARPALGSARSRPPPPPSPRSPRRR